MDVKQVGIRKEPNGIVEVIQAGVNRHRLESYLGKLAYFLGYKMQIVPLGPDTQGLLDNSDSGVSSYIDDFFSHKSP